MIEFRNVYKIYNNGTKALKDVNLKIESGEFVFIVGASGAGKSTLLKLMTREETASSGDIFINDFHLNLLKPPEIPVLRRTLGMVFQDFRLIDNMTVFDNIAFAMRIIGANKRQIRKRVAYVLSIVGLSHKARCIPTELSGGEQQRVGLARAFVNNPEIIIADEPTGNIDPAMTFEIMNLLSEINKRGTTVVVVTHEHNLVKHFNKRVIALENGRIAADEQHTGGAYEI